MNSPRARLIEPPATKEVPAVGGPVIAAIYPISKLSGEVETLYQYVRENHARFSSPGTEGYCEFRGVRFPRDILVNSLRREASLGRWLYELLGEEII
jgi:hypothetical protein